MLTMVLEPCGLRIEHNDWCLYTLGAPATNTSSRPATVSLNRP